MQSLQNCVPTAVIETVFKRNTNNQPKLEKSSSSWWSGVPMAPPDSIFGLVGKFLQDDSPRKINLSIGAYRDENGKPYVLPSVLKAEEKIELKNLDKEYTLPQGTPEFCSLSFDFAFGDTGRDLADKGLNATVQTLSGTGALSLAASFLKKFFPHAKTIYLPKPTWGNHEALFIRAGLETKYYRYYDRKIFGLDYNGILEDLCRTPEKSIILFHACAHNPTGVDPNKEQWKELCELVRQKKFFPVFDMAYQGFASVSPDDDAFAVRYFAENGIKLAVAQSYSKNMGLYGKRVGTLTILADSKEERAKITSQLKTLIRTTYSNPPIYGARIVTEILSDPQLKAQSLTEMKRMVEKISTSRVALYDNLVKQGSKHNWDHILKQIGMFTYTGMTSEQVDKMINDHHIYLTMDGRVAIAAISSKHVEYVASAMHQVTK